MHEDATHLLTFALRSQDTDALDDAVALLQAVRTASQDHPRHAGLLSDLGMALWTLYERSGELATLDEAVTTTRQAVYLTSPDHPDFALRLTTFGNVLRIRYKHTQDLTVLDEAITTLRQAVEATPPGHSDRAVMLPNLGNALYTRYKHAGDLATLNDAITVYHEIVSIAPPPSTHATHLENLGLCLFTRYKCTGEVIDLDEAISVYQQMIKTIPSGDPERVRCLDILGNTLNTRLAHGHLADLDGTIDSYQQVVEATSPDNPDRVAYLDNLSLCLFARYKLTGELIDLDEAITAIRQAVKLIPLSHPDRVTCLSNLGLILADRFQRTHALPDLDNVITVYREIFRTTPPDDPHRARRLSELGVALNIRFIRTGDAATVSEAIRIHLQAVEAAPTDHLDQVGALSDLGVALASRYVTTDEPIDLLRTVSVCRQAVEATPPDHLSACYLDTYETIGIGRRADQTTTSQNTDVALRLRVLGDVVRLRCTLTADYGMLSDMIFAYQQAVEAARPDDPDRGTHLFWLGNSLLSRYKLTNDPADLDATVATLQRAAEVTPSDHPRHASYLKALEIVRATLHVSTKDLEDLDTAIHVCRNAVEATPPDHPDYAARLSDLGHALYARWERTHTVDNLDLDEAISICRRAVQATAPDSPHLAQRLGLLGHILRLSATRYWLADETIATYQQAIQAARPDDPDRSAYLHWLATCLYARHEQTRDKADLDNAIIACRQAAEATPPDQPNHAKYLSDLAISLTSRFRHTGDPVDLDAAIRIGRQAVEATPPDQPDHAKCLATLATGLTTRFSHTGDSATLDEAIRTCRLADKLIPPGHVEHAICLSELGVALRAHFERSGDPASLDEAIRIGRQAVEAARFGHPEYTRSLSELGRSLHVRHRSTGNLNNLDEAIKISRRTIESHAGCTSSDCPDLWMNLSALGDNLLARYEATLDQRNWFRAFQNPQKAALVPPPDKRDRGSHRPDFATLFPGLSPKGALADLDEAITVSRRAARDVPPNRPDQAALLASLGFALHEHYHHEQQEIRLLHECTLDEPPSLDEALAMMRRAVDTQDAPPRVRIQAGRSWGAYAAFAGRWTEAAEGFRWAVGLLPRLASRHLNRSDQEHLLGLTSGLVSDAAACAVHCGDTEGALVLLEQGRGILLSHALDSRSDLTDLHAAAPELADKLIRLRDELDSPITPRPLGMHAEPRAVEQRMTDLRHERGREWSETVQQIRALPGFARFLQPPRLGDLLPAAAEGPVVTVNVSQFRCDALVLTTDGVRAVPLPDLNLDELHRQVSRFGDALLIADDSQHSLVDQMSAQAIIRATLCWLWDTITGPVLADLGHTEPPLPGKPWPRLWWSPTNVLNFLPLHAAGHHDQHMTQPATVIDRVVSSYTPTVRALQHARTRPALPPGSQRLLVVAMPDTPGQQRLPGASAEATAIAGRLPGPPPLIGANAIRDNVLAALQECAWTHFACHAHSDPTNPSTSSLILHDQPITVTDVTRLRLDHAELAYLSACATGRGGLRLPDEAIHIASAFQLAGYTHVVATLWSIGDDTAADVALRFYDRLHLIPNGMNAPRVALTLHEAMRDLREIHPLLATRWGAYVHAGP